MRIIKTLVSATVMATVFSAAAVEIIGHRGASFDAPENTVASERLGYEQGMDGGECDVYITTDGKLMVLHDHNTLRTTGVSNNISTTSSQVLRQLEAGQWGKFKGSKFSEKIPFLHELLEVMPAGRKMFVEIKTGPEILPELRKQLAASGKKDEQIVLISFNYDVVKQAKAMMPQYQVLFLDSANSKTKQYPSVESLIEKALAAKIDGLDLNSGFPIDKAFVEKVHRAGLKLYTWTVDDPQVARQEMEAGVDGITTNRPEWLRKQLQLTARR